MHITDIEVHAICPPYCDFNALALARYHGARIRMLREQCPLPIIGHHVPPEAMTKRYVDGTMAGVWREIAL